MDHKFNQDRIIVDGKEFIDMAHYRAYQDNQRKIAYYTLFFWAMLMASIISGIMIIVSLFISFNEFIK